MASLSPSPNSPPPPSQPSSPPPAAVPPPPATVPPPISSPPPSTVPPPISSPPPPSTVPPPISSPPPAAVPPPISSPPPTTVPPPISSPPPATVPPPISSPPPATVPPPNAAPPPVAVPTPSTSPPPATVPPPISSPPPATVPPPNSSPPPVTVPPPISSPPPATVPPPSRPPISSPPPTNSPSTRFPPPATSPPLPSSSPPPGPAATNSSSPPPLIAATPPPSRRPPPSPSEILISPPINPSNNDSSPNTPGGIGTGGIVGIAAVTGIVLLTVIITLSWCLLKRNKKKIAGQNEMEMGNSPQSDSGLLKIHTSAVDSANDFVYSPMEPGGLGNSRSKFNYEDLIVATDGFSPQNLLGSGGFGSVYKGFLADGTEIAVKELRIGGGQGEREFTSEVEIISRIHHRNLVSLVGYCISQNNRLLVYEYVPNNTLNFHLHVSDLALDWPTRIKVASGAARGIAYLHEDCHPRIIHRDIKSSNILLDKNFEARVSDFGLAKLTADMYTHVTTRVMGTFGYMAPEYASSGKLTEKSDVFSFGVVLLELITGRRPVDASQPLGDESLVEWARPLLSNALETEDFKLLVDPRLGTNFVPNEIFRMIEAAAACVRHSAAKRPRMSQIVRAFDSLETEDLSNGMRVGESEIYNSAQQDAEIRLFRRMAFGSQNYSTDFFTQSSCAPNSNER